MSIVVFWLEPDGRPAHQEFPAKDLLPALKHSEALRREGKRHVCISTALPDSVGQGGVNSVEGGKLPDGHVYDFNKAHRGAGPKPSN
ncbi:hypothetical protein [Piscinibacter gummiphilus]|uniref:Uncharacterized protein n=1 Tax=Piscinibacter gummiphilus TaxID=946333 RepID=A0ABZ0CYE7_9BURK|nr:hypothetical protein [Piscinibacter gummiphilus]WOB07514.1 hypothetical protein RXV79_21710 [Piscinibacter gummiphilus]